MSVLKAVTAKVPAASFAANSNQATLAAGLTGLGVDPVFLARMYAEPSCWLCVKSNLGESAPPAGVTNEWKPRYVSLSRGEVEQKLDSTEERVVSRRALRKRESVQGALG